MKEIGRGAQYKVIDTGNGSVLKVPLETDGSRAVVASWYAPDPIPSDQLKEISRYKQQARESCRTMQRIIVDFPGAAALVGNPHFEHSGQYIQDRVTPLGTVLENVPQNEAKHILDSYASGILACWQFGFSEKVFNFSVNNGLDQQGKVILVDFGEIATDLENIQSAIKDKRWLKAYSYKTLTKELQDYYRVIMEERLTAEALSLSWRNASHIA